MSKDNILKMYWAQDGLCKLCGEFMRRGEYSQDHVVPRSELSSPEQAHNNKQIVHTICNQIKGNSLKERPAAYYVEERKKWLQSGKKTQTSIKIKGR